MASDRPSKRKVETCLRISTKELPTRVRAVVFRDENPTVVVRRTATDRARVTVVEGGARTRVEVNLAELATPRGTHWTFICPISDSRVKVLYWDGRRLGSSKALGLSFKSQSLSPSKRGLVRKDRLVEAVQRPRLGAERRQELLRKLADTVTLLEGSAEPHLDALIAIEDAKQAQRARRQRCRGPFPVQSTKAALIRGRDRARYASDILRAELDRLAKGYALKAPPREHLTPALVSAFPELDIRALGTGQGRARAVRLIWENDGTGSPLTLHIRIDRRRNRLVLRYADPDGQPVVQVIHLAGGRRPGDRFMTCPYSGEPHLVLHYRDRWFAGRGAQHLLWPSQWSRTSQTRRAGPSEIPIAN